MIVHLFPATFTCVVQAGKCRKLDFTSDGVLPNEYNGKKGKDKLVEEVKIGKEKNNR